MAGRDLRSNALSSLMGGAPAKPTGGPAESRSRADGAARGQERDASVPAPPAPDKPAREKPQQAGASTKTSRAPGAPKRASAPKARAPKASAPKAERATPAEPARPDGYVGRSRYQRKGRGIVVKLAFHLSPDVARALRQAGAVGDANGENMSDIVETLLRRAGYGETE